MALNAIAPFFPEAPFETRIFWFTDRVVRKNVSWFALSVRIGQGQQAATDRKTVSLCRLCSGYLVLSTAPGAMVQTLL